MKIRTKLTLTYSGITIIVLFMFATLSYLTAVRNRSTAFYEMLEKKALTKANLLLDANIETYIFYAMYRNNRKYFDDLEVSIYSTDGSVQYCNDEDKGIAQVNSHLIEEIIENDHVWHTDDKKNQIVGFTLEHKGQMYVVIAADNDVLGYEKLHAMLINIVLLFFGNTIIVVFVGNYMSKKVLSPVNDVVSQAEKITAQSLNQRIIVKISNDEIGEMAKTFNNVLDRLEASFEAQKMFVSNVSHELRTPLAALIGEIKLALLRQRTTEEYGQVLENLLMDADKLIKVINGLLDFAKANYDVKEIAQHEVRLDEIILDARELVLKGNNGYKVEIVSDENIEDDNLISVWGNEYLLRTTFINLIENNCKFSENHTSYIHISTDETYIYIKFADKGIGIPPQDLERLFTPFFRGQNQTYAFGSGIGMALVKRVLTMHHASIDVKSTVGEGTEFLVRINNVKHHILSGS